MVQSLRVGCPKWQPDSESAVSEEIAEGLRLYLLKYKDFDENDEETSKKAVEAMSDSFPFQRLFLNNVYDPPTYVEIEASWPCLLSLYYMLIHFLILTDCSYRDVLSAIKEDLPFLLAYGKLHQYFDFDELITENQQNIAAIKVIFQYFKEEFGNLFVTLDVSNLFKFMVNL